MKKTLGALGLLTLATVASPASAASLIGDTIKCTSGAIFSCPAASATVSASTIEFGLTTNSLTYNFTAQGLTISNTFAGSSAYLGDVMSFSLAFADVTHAFTNASLGTVSGVTGITAQTFSLTNGVLKVGVGGLTFAKNGSFNINLGTAAANGAVPEPATWAMMILGMGAVGFALRRRNAVATAIRFA